MALTAARIDSSREAIAAAADIVGHKWTALILNELADRPQRFRDLALACGRISTRTLAERLRHLEDAELVAALRRRVEARLGAGRADAHLLSAQTTRELLAVVETLTRREVARARAAAPSSRRSAASR